MQKPKQKSPYSSVIRSSLTLHGEDALFFFRVSLRTNAIRVTPNPTQNTTYHTDMRPLPATLIFLYTSMDWRSVLTERFPTISLHLLRTKIEIMAGLDSPELMNIHNLAPRSRVHDNTALLPLRDVRL